jgi:hypothetical protein
MRRFARSFLLITFSDMKVAHFGSDSMYLAGIRTVDRLIGEVWDHSQTLPSYKGSTTLIVLPEFGLSHSTAGGQSAMDRGSSGNA